MSDSPENDFLEAEVESTIAPLRAMGLSPEAVQEAANLVRMGLTAHPGGRHLMSLARPRVQKESGSSPIDGVRDIPAKAGSSR
jgi:hypothetical protein